MRSYRTLISTLLLFAILLFQQQARGQNAVERLQQWHRQHPIEKVYLQLDRQDYFAGQTCWFKAYFLSDFKASLHNSTLFVELINRSGRVLYKKVLPVFNAVSYGQLELPDSLGTGTYQLRAYTPLMLNQDKSFLYYTPIRVYSRRNRSAVPTEGGANLQFFPEGGTLVAGLTNNLAFKATDEQGRPLPVEALIQDDQGREITRIESTHDGRGRFLLEPVAGRSYTAVFKGDSFPLPAAVTEGLALELRQQQGGLELQLNHRGPETFKPAYIIGQMQHQVLFKVPVQNGQRTRIPTDTLHSGVLQLTVFNSQNLPLAERLAFIDNGEYRLQAQLETTKLATGARKANRFLLRFDQPVEGNFSVAITDEAYNLPGPRPDNIVSSLLLTSDLPGYIHNPAHYFSDAPAAADNLDLVMLTNGWRRFSWTRMAQTDPPAPAYTDPGYISLSGKVNVRDSRKSFADRELLVWVATADSGQSLQLLKTDAEGRFSMDSVVFFDKARILFSDVMGDKSQYITVKLNTDSLYRSFDLPVVHRPAAGNADPELRERMAAAQGVYNRQEGILLDNVEVEGRRMTLEELEDKYLSGMFRGNINARTINLTGQFIPQFNIFEWLMGRVPGLQINPAGNFYDNYRLRYRNGPVQLFLDEMPLQDATMISSLPASEIALIKIYPQFIGARGNQAAIAVYTKRGDDLNASMEATGDIVDYDGYSIIKEFYAPDYSQPPEMNYRDYRLTLNWLPELKATGQQELPIEFYNNDRSKSFRIVCEGLTADGRMLMLEKVLR
ncbi:Plug domain-containing protein [Niabella terrae]